MSKKYPCWRCANLPHSDNLEKLSNSLSQTPTDAIAFLDKDDVDGLSSQTEQIDSDRAAAEASSNNSNSHCNQAKSLGREDLVQDAMFTAQWVIASPYVPRFTNVCVAIVNLSGVRNDEH